MELRIVLKKLLLLLLIFASLPVLGKPQYASIVMEYPSRTILYSENPTLHNQPASLTKVMTLYLVFRALDNGTLRLDQLLTVSAHASNRQPSKLGLKVNDSITVEQAICGLVTKSANDAAAVLAESLAPTEDEFALVMTQEARKLGMVNTVFRNASGIADNQQTTTALDMALLGASIMHDYPHYYHYFSLRDFYFHNHVFKNHNHLLGKYTGADGIKTGFTTASGFNLLSSASRDGHRLIAVVLGGTSIKSRDQRMMQLLDQGFAKFSNSTPSRLTPVYNPTNPELNSSALPLLPKVNPLAEPLLEKPNTTIEEAF